MKNRDLVRTLNGLYALREREDKRKEKGFDPVFKGRTLLVMSRNLRALEKEYNENYIEDYTALREKYYVKKTKEVVIPEDKKNGIEEHKEDRTVEVLRPKVKQEDYDKELNELLDLEVKVPIMRVPLSDLENVSDAIDSDVVAFMVDYGECIQVEE